MCGVGDGHFWFHSSIRAAEAVAQTGWDEQQEIFGKSQHLKMDSHQIGE